MKISKLSLRKGVYQAALSTFFAVWKYPLTKLSFNSIAPELAALLDCVLTVIFGWLHEKSDQKLFLKASYDRWIVICSILNATGVLLVFETLSRMHPVSVFLIGRFYYVYTFILAYLFLKETTSNRQAFLLLSLVIGIFLSEWQNKWPTFDFNIILALTWPFCFALQHALVKKIVSDKNSTQSSAQFLMKTRFLSVLPVLIYVVYKQPSLQNILFKDVVLLLISIYFSIFLSTLLLFNAFKTISFITANLIRCYQPLGILLISSLFFPKTLEPIQIVGFIIIILSLLFYGMNSKQIG